MTNTLKCVISAVSGLVVGGSVTGYILYKRGYGDGYLAGAVAATKENKKTNTCESELKTEEVLPIGGVRSDAIDAIQKTYEGSGVDTDAIEAYIRETSDEDFERELAEAKRLGRMYDTGALTLGEVEELQLKLRDVATRDEALRDMEIIEGDHPECLDEPPEVSYDDYPDLAPNGDILDPDDVLIDDRVDPFLIAADRYSTEKWDGVWNKIAVTYCTEDGLVVDDGMNVMDNAVECIGETNLMMLMHSANNVIFVRNNALHTDYEIDRYRGTAAEYTGNDVWAGYKPGNTRGYIDM